MDEGQDLMHTTVYVIQDTIPEDTETFYVFLRNPAGGAEIGVNNRIAVNILSNDNAHGIFEIAQVRFKGKSLWILVTTSLIYSIIHLWNTLKNLWKFFIFFQRLISYCHLNWFTYHINDICCGLTGKLNVMYKTLD